jgi:hypothetical protein
VNLRLVLVLSSVVFSAACGASADPCSRNSPCPNDTPATQAERDQCKAQLNANANAACYSDYLSYANCYLDQTVCGGNGQSDTTLTATKAMNNCTNQRANLSSCCIKNPNSTVCS